MAKRFPEPDKSLAQAFEEDVYKALVEMPSLQAAIAEGEGTGNIGYSSEEFVAALQRIILALADHVGRLAQEVDRLRAQARLDQEPGS